MKKALISMFALSLVIVILSSASFAAEMPKGRVGLRNFAFHKTNIIISLNLSSNQKVQLMAFFKDNKEKMMDIQKQLKSSMKDLKNLIDKKNSSAEYNVFSNDIDNKIANYKTIIGNYRDQLRFMKTEQAKDLKNILTVEQYAKLQNMIKNKQQFAYKNGNADTQKKALFSRIGEQKYNKRFFHLKTNRNRDKRTLWKGLK